MCKSILASVAKSLRLLAATVESANSPRQLIEIIFTLQTTITAMNLCLFKYQENIIKNAKHEIDPAEFQQSGMWL